MKSNAILPVAMIGNGGAAAEAVKALRNRGYDGEIHVFSDTDMAPYNPMLVTYYASGKLGWEGMFPYGQNFYEEYGVSFHGKDPVVKVDALSRSLTTAGGEVFYYEKCLVATGAVPFVPLPIPEDPFVKERILTARTVEDGEKMKAALEGAVGKVLVIGASMIGIKAVEAFLNKGFEVCFADLAEHIFPLAAHPRCSELIEEYLAEKGVKLRFGTTVNELSAENGKVRAAFTDGQPAESFDWIVACVGVRANLSFLDKEQVEIDRGILVNEKMETNCPGLYAAGDVAQGRDLLSGRNMIIGLWANGRSQGRCAGENMAGGNAVYRGTFPHNITHFMDQDFIGFGYLNDGDDFFEGYDPKARTYCRLVWKDGKLTGINLLNLPEISGIVKNHMTKMLLQNEMPDLSSLEKNTMAMNKLYHLYPKLAKKLSAKGGNVNE
ncbi:MAG: FAD-dependent oxidoreductase [Firmicutes bacterium]|nr:FAD-dependent oxidoreductase [Bacillota bacterium]